MAYIPFEDMSDVWEVHLERMLIFIYRTFDMLKVSRGVELFDHWSPFRQLWTSR